MKICGGRALNFEVEGFHRQYVHIKKLTNKGVHSLLVQDGLMVPDDKQKVDYLIDFCLLNQCRIVFGNDEKKIRQ